MNKSLLILSSNILVISSLILLYGVVNQEPSLIGVSLSSILTGLVLLMLSFAVSESIINSLTEYLSLTNNALTSVIENVDLLESDFYVARVDNELRLVMLKRGKPEAVIPGLGVKFGEPYLAIPVENVLEEVTQVNEVTEKVVETNLNSVLVDTLGLCGRVVVKLTEKLIRVDLINVNKVLRRFEKMPLDPAKTLVAVATARLVGKDLKLSDSGNTVGGVYYVFEVIE